MLIMADIADSGRSTEVMLSYVKYICRLFRAGVGRYRKRKTETHLDPQHLLYDEKLLI